MTSFAHQLRQALLTTFDSSVGPVLLDLEAKANTQEQTAAWERRHAGAVAEARRQEHRAALLAEALGDVLRKFPKRDRTKHAWEDRLIVSHSVYRDDLARWGQLIPDSRRGRDWRRNTVLRTKRDATNKQLAEANRRAYSAEAGARGAAEAHRQELQARSQAEIGWREALAEVKRLKAELGDAPQQIAKLRKEGNRLAQWADRHARDHAAEERRHAETKRRYASTIRQAQREHLRAEQLAAEVEQLRAELADYQLADSEQQGAAQRLCGATIQSSLGTGTLVGPCIRSAGHPGDQHEAADGAKWELLVVATPDAFVDLRALAQEQLREAQAQEAAHVDRVLLGVEPSPWAADGARAEVLFPQLAKYAAECERRDQAAPCWCGHDPDAHVTDDSDTAICRGCWTVNQLHRAFHVHTPEASQ